MVLLADYELIMDDDNFIDWLSREMPAGTVIGDPKWWAKRILKVIRTPSPQPVSEVAKCPNCGTRDGFHNAIPEAYCDKCGYSDGV